MSNILSSFWDDNIIIKGLNYYKKGSIINMSHLNIKFIPYPNNGPLNYLDYCHLFGMII